MVDGTAWWDSEVERHTLWHDIRGRMIKSVLETDFNEPAMGVYLQDLYLTPQGRSSVHCGRLGMERSRWHCQRMRQSVQNVATGLSKV